MLSRVPRFYHAVRFGAREGPDTLPFVVVIRGDGFSPVPAPADTLLGQLQRGRGEGFLRALEAPAREAHAVLIECITHDPRWDTQVESRADYYGDLAVSCGLDPSPLAVWLRENDDADERGRSAGLTVEVLGRLVARGSFEAVAILRGYVESGYWWGRALEALVQGAEREAWADLDGAVGARCPRGESLDEFAACEAEPREPWLTWARRDTPFGVAVGRSRSMLPAGYDPQAEAARLASLSTEALLDERGGVALDRELAARRSPADARILLAAASGGSMAARRAMRALAEQRDLRVLELARCAVEHPWPSRFEQHGRYRVLVEGGTTNYTAGIQALRALPSAVVRPLALEWRSRFRDRRRWWAAVSLIADHPRAEDVGWIRRWLRGPITPSRHACTFLEMLEQLAPPGPFSEATTLFAELPYSCGREQAARAIAASDPGFAGGLALECLWDCEAGTRLLAAEHVDLGVPGARERLTLLADDALEDDHVRDAARERLGPAAGAVE